MKKRNLEAVRSIQPTDNARVVPGARFCCKHLVPGHKKKVHLITPDLVAVQYAAPRKASRYKSPIGRKAVLQPVPPPAPLDNKRKREVAAAPVESVVPVEAPLSAASLRAEAVSLRIDGLTPNLRAELERRAFSPGVFGVLSRSPV